MAQKPPQRAKPKVDTTWMAPKKQIWVENTGTQEIFQPAILESFDAKGVKVKFEDGSFAQKELHMVYERGIPDEYNDMVDMEVINDAELLVNLKKRYEKNLIFTYVGPTLLVVNPFKAIPNLVSQEMKDSFIKYVVTKDHKKNYPPHIYAIGAEAYRGLYENEKNQAIVISGESGAGKTENAKLCMNILTAIKFPQLNKQLSRVDSDKNYNKVPIEDKIISCNPILEALGNAKTLRNNNSSRFGKYTKIYLAKQERKIKGADITNYLLEKSRLCVQGKGERNFHIFYFFLKGMDPEELEKLFLCFNGNRVQFKDLTYLNTVSDVDGIDDVKLFKEILESIETLGLQTNKDNIFSILAAVIHLGDLQFDDSTLTNNTPCLITNQEKVQYISTLLKMTVEEVTQALVYKSIEIQKQIINSPIPKLACMQNRDSWAKELYERLFNWLVIQLNQTILPAQKYSTTIGLLDIYGFEVFEKNGFEQLMINYTNEKLHQLYISYVFKQEFLVFGDEGLGKFCEQIKFSDNQGLIEFLDKPPLGIFDLLDESCQIKGDDDTLLQKIRKTHKDPNLILQPKMPTTPSFIVVHTAKEVEYSIQGFREKNMDEISILTQKNSSNSGNQLVSKLFTVEPTQGKKDKSLSKKIRSQMTELMKELNSCDVHFVRCIKPNDVKKPLVLEQDYTLKQIRYLGVLDSLKVRKENYPIRRGYPNFYSEYWMMTNYGQYETLLEKGQDFRQVVQNLFKDYCTEMGPSMVLFGLNKIFIRIEGMIVFQDKYKILVEKKKKIIMMIMKNWQLSKLKRKIKFKAMIARRIKRALKRLRQRIHFKKVIIAERQKKLELYRIQMGNIMLYLHRYQAMQLHKTRLNKIIVLQRNFRKCLFLRKLKKLRHVRFSVNYIFEQIWIGVQNVQAIKIQKVFRGYIVRKQNKQLVQQIKKAKQDCIDRIQEDIRITKLRNEKARQIQGFIKMKWLSSTFQQMRKSAIKIQRMVRAHQIRSRAKQEKLKKYQQPLEQQFLNQKMIEENDLFDQTIESIIDFSILEDTFNDGKISGFNEILKYDRDPQKINRKAFIFDFIIDLELLIDTSDFFKPSFAKNYKSLFQHCYLTGNMIQYVAVGATHAIAATQQGRLYSWGINTEGQLGTDEYAEDPVRPVLINFPYFPEQIACTSFNSYVRNSEGQVIIWGAGCDQMSIIDCEPAKQIATNNDTTYLLSQNGDVYFWCNNLIISKIMVEKITQISCGQGFAMFINQSGTLYTYGSNDQGQLGQGDTKDRPTPQTIKLKQIISYVSCGLKHAVCKTQSNKLYIWGWNLYGQLGIGDFKNRLEPYILALQVNQIHAGRTSTIAIDNKQILWAGSNASISYQTSFIPVNLKAKASALLNSSPIRIITTYSKSISLIQISFLFQNDVWKGNLNLQKGYIQQLTTKWMEENINSIDPPQIDSISKFLMNDHMKKSKQVQRPNSPKAYISQKRVYMQPKQSVAQTEQIEQAPPIRISLNTAKESKTESRDRTQTIEQQFNHLADLKQKIARLKDTPQNDWTQEDKEFMGMLQTWDINLLIDL
ncbi:hypothetical protein pb186bvf_020010 [Paramecium bursaria]